MIGNDVSTGLQSMMDMTAQNGENVSYSTLKEVNMSNAQDSVFDQGTILLIPDVDHLEGRLGAMKMPALPGRAPVKAYYILVDTEAHGPKRLFFGTLVKNARKYEEREGRIVNAGTVHSDTELYKTLSPLKNVQKMLDVIAGKKLAVTQVLNFDTAHYTNGLVDGLRQGQVPCFEIVKEA